MKKKDSSKKIHFLMLKFTALLWIVLINFSINTYAQQKVIRLYNGPAPGSEKWNWKESEGINPMNNTSFAYNVTSPTLTIFNPDAGMANGSAVLLIPGGNLQVVMLEHEGLKTARELVKKGVTVFVLKSRVSQLVTDNPWQEMMTKMRDTSLKRTTGIKEMARADATEAIKYIRSHADEMNIDKTRIGMVGFSSGAVITLNLLAELQPSFIGLIYGVYPVNLRGKLTGNLPPAFITVATDDQLIPVQHSLDLYSEWLQKKAPVELHVYAKGGHGLNGIPANTWVFRFAEWMESIGLLKKH